jgi:prophage tail gpP-like protein
MWAVDVQDSMGNLLVSFSSVPGNTKDEAIQLVRGKMILVATQMESQGMVRQISIQGDRDRLAGRVLAGKMIEETEN